MCIMVMLLYKAGRLVFFSAFPMHRFHLTTHQGSFQNLDHDKLCNIYNVVLHGGWLSNDAIKHILCNVSNSF